MPQSDKEITETLGIPRLTLHSWKIGNGYTRLLYSMLKNMSVSELEEKRGMAEQVFNLLINFFKLSNSDNFSKSSNAKSKLSDIFSFRYLFDHLSNNGAFSEGSKELI